MAKEIITYIEDSMDFDQYGCLHLFKIFSKDFFDAGYNIGDIITLSFNGKEYDLPVALDFNFLDMGKAGLCTEVLGADYLMILSLGVSFAESTGMLTENDISNDQTQGLWSLKEGYSFPIEIKISLKEKGGYLERLKLFELVRTYKREDYSDFTDDEYCNFRMVTSGKIKPNRLYRTSSPIDPRLKREEYADKACKREGIKSTISLSDRESLARKHPNFENTYYSTCNNLFLSMPPAYFNKRFNAGFVTILRFIIEKPAPFAIHCLEGKDRTGYTLAIIECLCGASIEEIKKDYTLSYVNFFKVKPNSYTYKELSKRIEDLLLIAFKKDSLENVDLVKESKKYLINLGLTKEEVTKLRSKFVD